MFLLPKIRRGFTLIELLVVIGVLTVLLAIVLVAINPDRQFKQANDTQRRSDVNAILNAIHQYAVDNNGTLPSGIPSGTAKVIGSDTVGGEVNLCSALVPTYMADLPIDPTTGTESPAASVCTDSGATYSTGYSVVQSSSDNRVTVSATAETAGTTISVTR